MSAFGGKADITVGFANILGRLRHANVETLAR